MVSGTGAAAGAGSGNGIEAGAIVPHDPEDPSWRAAEAVRTQVRAPRLPELERWVRERRTLLEGVYSEDDWTGGFGQQAVAWDGLSQLDDIARDAPGSAHLGGAVGKLGVGRPHMPFAMLWAGHPSIRLRVMAAMRPWEPLLRIEETREALHGSAAAGGRNEIGSGSSKETDADRGLHVDSEPKPILEVFPPPSELLQRSVVEMCGGSLVDECLVVEFGDVFPTENRLHARLGVVSSAVGGRE